MEEFGALLAPKAAANLGALQNASKEIGKFVFVFSGKEDKMHVAPNDDDAAILAKERCRVLVMFARGRQ